jgi:hypothetical protein
MIRLACIVMRTMTGIALKREEFRRISASGSAPMSGSTTALDKPVFVEPGQPAPVSGTYEEADSLGRTTGTQVAVQKDELLPDARYGYRWRLHSRE